MISIAVLFLFCGVMLPAYGQRNHKDEKQSKSEEHRGPQKQRAESAAQQHRPEAKSEGRGQQQRQVQQREHAQPAQHPQPQRVREVRQEPPAVRSEQVRRMQPRSREQAIVWQKQRGWAQHNGWQGHGTWQQTRARLWKTEHRTWAQRGGYGGYYIPESRFRIYFGRQHWFRIHRRPVIYMGYPRFEYAGFSFLLVDPWPESWAENWYETDDVYVDYDDGYYLYHRRDPGIRLAITVLVN